LSQRILAAPTPAAWVDAAAVGWQELLVDHANCEKKAASSALALLFAYPEDTELGLEMARLAREELRHFEQVARQMRAFGVPFVRQRPGRYGGGLRSLLRTSEPGRKIDLLVAGALIEARSSERFGLLAVRLPEALAGFYADLERCEARHFELYLGLAQRAARSAGVGELDERLRELAQGEAELACAPDDGELRFHSGPPGVSARACAPVTLA
jgi:tRNA-(ms[2]io[6]A)-hydroxylase